MRLSRRTTRQVRACGAAAVAVLGITMLVGCISHSDAKDAADAPSTTDAPVTAQAPLSQLLQRYIAAVDAINLATPQTLVTSSARATIDPANPAVEPMTFRDESSSELAAGNYSLLTYCAGSGSYDATFTIDGTTTRQRHQCGAEPLAGNLSFHLPEDATVMSVELDPADDTKAAIAYRVQADNKPS